MATPSFFVFFLQTGGFGHQLEIVIVTCQSGTSIQKQVEVTSLDLEQLKVSTAYIMSYKIFFMFSNGQGPAGSTQA